MIPQDFYKEETRCDFLVTTKRKKVWAIQLEILNIFKEICAKYKLKYFAVDGTLLGVVRHKGFIPWDDDIDVAMPRSDFERLLKVVRGELSYYEDLIIQYETFDKNYSTPHARITNIKTTAYFPHVWRTGLDVPQGIFIDIFPYDNVPNSQWKKKIHRLVYKSVAYMLHDKQNKYTYENSSMSARILRICSRLLFLFTDVDTVFNWTQKHIQKYNLDFSCKKFGGISTFYQIEQEAKLKEWFDELVELPYENTFIACPKMYEDVLSHTFGDWKKMIKGGSMHDGCFYDPDKPYTYYKGLYEKNLPNTL